MIKTLNVVNETLAKELIAKGYKCLKDKQLDGYKVYTFLLDESLESEMLGKFTKQDFYIDNKFYF